MTTAVQETSTAVRIGRAERIAFWKSKSGQRRMKKLSITGILLLGLAPVLLPYYWTVVTAFKTIDQIHTWPPVWFPNPISLEAFEVMPEVFPFWWASRNTMTVMMPRALAA